MNTNVLDALRKWYSEFNIVDRVIDMSKVTGTKEEKNTQFNELKRQITALRETTRKPIKQLSDDTCIVELVRFPITITTKGEETGGSVALRIVDLQSRSNAKPLWFYNKKRYDFLKSLFTKAKAGNKVMETILECMDALNVENKKTSMSVARVFVSKGSLDLDALVDA